MPGQISEHCKNEMDVIYDIMA